jgi:hypothetical protein
MMADSIPPFVSSVAPGTWVLESAQFLTEELASLNAAVSQDGDRLTLCHSPSDDSAMAAIAVGLRSLGFYFSDGRDWSPKAYLHHLRDAGLFAGPIPEIYWTAPGKSKLREDS